MTTPTRQATGDTTRTSSSKSTDAFAGSDVDDSLSDTEDYGMPRIFLKATQWSRVLDIGKDWSTKLGLSSPKDIDAERSVSGFADLVGRDLDRAEKAKTCRFAKLQVNAWRIKDGTLGGPPTLSEDSESDKDDDKERLKSVSPEDAQAVAKTLEWAEGAADVVEERRSPSPLDIPTTASPITETPPEGLGQIAEEIVNGEAKFESVSNLSPEEIVKLLVDEFGSLAAEGEEERLLLESDARVHERLQPHGADPAPARVLLGHARPADREPGPRHVVPPPVPGRRVAALRLLVAERLRRPRAGDRAVPHPRR